MDGGCAITEKSYGIISEFNKKNVISTVAVCVAEQFHSVFSLIRQ